MLLSLWPFFVHVTRSGEDLFTKTEYEISYLSYQNLQTCYESQSGLGADGKHCVYSWGHATAAAVSRVHIRHGLLDAHERLTIYYRGGHVRLPH